MSAGAEHGDRAAFLGRVRARQGPPPVIGPHPPPPAPSPGEVPEVRYRSLDAVAPGDTAALVAVFADAARGVSAVVHDSGDLGAAVAAVVEQLQVHTAVVSAEAELAEVSALLEGLGVAVAAYEPGAAAVADLGVTSAVAGIAATGSVVLDADAAGSRGAGLLPPVHLCVLARARVVATPSDVLRRGSRPLPSNRVLVTGPSRTGDIEQIITLGAHGPVALHIALI